MTVIQAQLLAADLMTIDPITVAMDAPVEEAERLIRLHHVSGLPVTDGQGGALS